MNTSEQNAFMNRGQKTSHLDIDGENPFPISENFWVLDALRSLDGDVGSVDGANDSGVPSLSPTLPMKANSSFTSTS